MQHELLLEIGTEEIPAGFLMPAIESMSTILGRKLTTAGLTYASIDRAATPRRLTICVNGLLDRQPDRVEEIIGPPRKAAFDNGNNPTKAAHGFAKTNQVAVDELKMVTTAKGEYLMAIKQIKGVDTDELLPAMLSELIQEQPFPKSMKWGIGRATFVRPIQWLLALYNGKVIPFSLDTITTGNLTRGHRFLAPATIPVKDYSSYLDQLKRAHVLVSPAERRQAVIAAVNQAAEQLAGIILADDELVDTVTNLVEEPHAVCGSFDRRFLVLPREVLITSMREHQKYFAVVDENDTLLPNFVAVNNTRVRDTKIAIDGHQRVLRARLEDALFFFKEDQHLTLADRIPSLSGIIFQAKLGSLAEKTERITTLAGLLAEKLAPDQVATAKRAAFLAKADLLTAMVNEFPSLQGSMGQAYARLDGETPEVALAIYEHYLPIRAGASLPTGLPGALVGIADRIDSIAGCFGIGQLPTGATDPFGLRRLSLGLLQIIQHHSLCLSLTWLVDEALRLYGGKLTVTPDKAKQQVIEFIKARYVNDMISRGTPIEAVEAVTSIAFDDVLDCRLRTNALLAASRAATFPMLAGAFKRVNNIIKDHQDTTVRDELLTEPAEKELYEAYKDVSEQIAPLLAQRQYQQAMDAILTMKDKVDLFFAKVMVMVDDAQIKNNRLALLTAIAHLFLKIGDFSRMSGLMFTF
ncbi:MAG: glycine--tRNA ligase subunit beta [Deltaproteobacteria bacterium RIFOXYD12_FULL_50_9]|nr:MAG: glycine--tRNA ligase subunit beta [Deltaproteobacteria bacterium RIFOXYD12_FULL_50_9]